MEIRRVRTALFAFFYPYVTVSSPPMGRLTVWRRRSSPCDLEFDVLRHLLRPVSKS